MLIRFFVLCIFSFSILLAGCASSTGGPKVSQSWYGIGATTNVTGPNTFGSRGTRLFVPFYAWYNPEQDLVLFQVAYHKYGGKSTGGKFEVYPAVQRSIYLLDPQTHIGAAVTTKHAADLLVRDGHPWNSYIVPEDEKVEFFPEVPVGQAVWGELSPQERLVISKFGTPIDMAIKVKNKATSFFNFGEPWGGKAQNYLDKQTLDEFNRELIGVIAALKSELRANPSWKETEVQGSAENQKKFRSNALDSWFKTKAYCPEPGWTPYCDNDGRVNVDALKRQTNIPLTADVFELYRMQCAAAKATNNNHNWDICDGGRYGAGNYFQAAQHLPELAVEAEKKLKGKRDIADLAQFLVSLRNGGH